MKRIIASDYDGTINRGGISAYDVEQIRKWQDNGNYFGIVTGRILGFEKDRIWTESGVRPDFFVLCNGAVLMDGSGNIMKEYLIPREICLSLQKKFEDYPGFDLVYYDTVTDAEFYHCFYAQFQTITRARIMTEEINKEFGDSVYAVTNHWHVNIMKKGVSKRTGVLDALEYYGLEKDQAAAIGDDWNDMDMVRGLDGWVVATASEAIRAEAPHVCDSVGKLAEILMK